MEIINIVVVDDHPIFRQGVVDALSLEDDFNVIDQAASGEQALVSIRELKPHVAIVDVNLPGMNGQQVTRQIVGEKLPVKVVLLTAYDDIEQMIHAFRAGAYAYCAKDVHPEKLVDVVRQIHQGKYVIGDLVCSQNEVEDWLQNQTEHAIRSYSDPGEPYYPLSDRETEVLSCVTKGLSNKEIAGLLGISHQTVKNHVTSILRKIGVEDRTQAAIYALKRGWFRLNVQENDGGTQE